MKKLVLWLLTILQIVVIFYFSSQDAVDSAELSKNLSDNIIRSAVEIITDNKVQQNIMLANVHTFIRELAHIFIYFVLGICLTALVKEYPLARPYLFAIIACIICSVLDEINQAFFTVGRSFQIIDLLKDWFGAICATWIVKKVSKC